jgi:peptidoglycan glycosyltransferase
MVSSPTYAPADPPEITEGDSKYEGVYINRFLSSTYTPGSIFKLVTLAAAIENIDDLYDRTFTCDGSLEIAGDTVRCTRTHGTLNIEEALAVSCNVTFAHLSEELGGTVLKKYADQFGLTSSLSVDGIKTAAGNFDVAEDGTANLAWSGIGQYNDTVNPCAMLRLMGAIANGGVAVEPELIVRKGLSGVFSGGSSRLMSADTADQIATMMNYNVVYTYGEENFPGLELYAKSGTAEVGGGEDPHAWFVGFIKNEDYPWPL